MAQSYIREIQKERERERTVERRAIVYMNVIAIPKQRRFEARVECGRRGLC